MVLCINLPLHQVSTFRLKRGRVKQDGSATKNITLNDVRCGETLRVCGVALQVEQCDSKTARYMMERCDGPADREGVGGWGGWGGVEN